MASSGFLIAFLLTPALTNILYKYKLWRKTVRQEAMGGGALPIFKKFHQEGEVKTPRFGGVLIWITPPFLALLFFILSKTGSSWFEGFNFLSRGETWLPLATLIIASGVGFLDDIVQVISGPKNAFLNAIWEKISKYTAGGLSLKLRFSLVFLIALTGAWWFFAKLGIDSIFIPGIGDVFLGWLMIPFFIIVMLASYSGGVIDGIDGLSGGAFASMFTAYGLIALWQGQIDLATLCFAIVGAILAFLWFNIPPARFYMGETGVMGLTATLTVIAFLTDSVAVLPIIGILLVAESASVIIQVTSKKLRHGKKVFLAAPIHHHFEGMGWPSVKVTMRFWIAIRLLG